MPTLSTKLDGDLYTLMSGVSATDESNRRVTVLLRIRADNRPDDSVAAPKPSPTPP